MTDWGADGTEDLGAEWEVPGDDDQYGSDSPGLEPLGDEALGDSLAPVWETAPADDLSAAVLYAEHLAADPYDHPALSGYDDVSAALDDIAGPEAVAEILGVPYAEGMTLEDVTWAQLGLDGSGGLQDFIAEQSAYVDQLAMLYDPGLDAPVEGYEAFYGPLGLQTASGVELPTLGGNSWFGASHDLHTVLGPYYDDVFVDGQIAPNLGIYAPEAAAMSGGAGGWDTTDYFFDHQAGYLT